MRAVSMSKKLLKTNEAAQVLNVSVATLEKWRQRGLGPEFQRLGPKTIRYHVEALATYQVASIVAPRES